MVAMREWCQSTEWSMFLLLLPLILSAVCASPATLQSAVEESCTQVSSALSADAPLIMRTMCQFHAFSYKEARFSYDNSAKAELSNRGVAAYSTIPTYMSMEQYLKIVTTIFELEETPAVLYFGCREDASVWDGPRRLVKVLSKSNLETRFIKELKGSIVFVAENGTRLSCGAGGNSNVDVREAVSKGSHQRHKAEIEKNLKNRQYLKLKSEIYKLPSDLLPLTVQFNIIILDSPKGMAASSSRSISVITAIRLMEGYSSKHMTHLFFRDALKGWDFYLVDKVLTKTTESGYQGAVTRRNPLRHWVVAGKGKTKDNSLPRLDAFDLVSSISSGNQTIALKSRHKTVGGNKKLLDNFPPLLPDCSAVEEKEQAIVSPAAKGYRAKLFHNASTSQFRSKILKLFPKLQEEGRKLKCETVVYTALFGGHDTKLPTLPNFSCVVGDTCNVAVIDETTRKKLKILSVADPFEGYKVIVIDVNVHFTDLARAARSVKVLSHLWFPHAKRIVWIDSKLDMMSGYSWRDLYCAAEVTQLAEEDCSRCENSLPEMKYLYIGARHEYRMSSYREGYFLIKHTALDTTQNLEKAMNISKDLGMPENYGLTDTMISIRSNVEDNRKFNEIWYYLITTASKRDQMSIMSVIFAMEAKCRVALVPYQNVMAMLVGRPHARK